MRNDLIVKLAQLVEAIPIEKNVKPVTFDRAAPLTCFWMDGTSACLIPWGRELLGNEDFEALLLSLEKICPLYDTWLFASRWAELAGTPKDAAHRLYYIAATGDIPILKDVHTFNWEIFTKNFPFDICKKMALESL